jgi:hypothetical protein
MTNSKAPLVGSGSGAIAGFLLGGPIGALVGAGIGFLGGKRYSVVHGMTPERKKIYEEALKSMADPAKLRALADGYEKEGLKEEAETLRKRAQLRELPPEQKAQRKESFRKYMSVGTKENPATPDKIATLEKAAQVFHAQGATGNAAKLREHVAALKKMLAAKVG